MLEINKIYTGDCRQLLLQLDDNSIDITITSPPYNVGNNNMTNCKYTTYEDNLSQEDYFFLLDFVINELIRVTKYYVFFNIQILSFNKKVIFELIGKYKNYIKDIIIWDKNTTPPQIEDGVLNNKFEFVLIFSKYNPEKRKFDRCFFKQGSLNNIIKGKNNSDNRYSNIHSAVFPIYFVEFFIKNFTQEGDLILDPFAGLGTTLLCAKLHNRNFIGFEIEPKYCEIANKRLKQENIKKWFENEPI